MTSMTASDPAQHPTKIAGHPKRQDPKSGLRAEVFTEEPCYFALGEPPLRNGERQIDKLRITDVDLYSIQLEKDKSRGDSHSLISVDKGVVLDNVKEVSCCHLEQIGMEIFLPTARLRHCNSRLEEPRIPKALGSSIPLYLVTVDLQNFMEFEE